MELGAIINARFDNQFVFHSYSEEGTLLNAQNLKTRPRTEPVLLTRRQRGYMAGKFLLDFLICATATAFLLIPMALVALAIKIDDPGPALFTQKRVGRNQKYFMLLKFRTMRADTPHDIPTHQLENPQQYITRVGRFLRKSSLDELPQLFNILLGQMSIVGPRPALWNQFDLVEEREQYGVHQVRPGLTGWAQINGRDELEIPDKAALDAEYVRHFGLRMDLKCFFGTFGVLFTGKGVVEGGTGALHEENQE